MVNDHTDDDNIVQFPVEMVRNRRRFIEGHLAAWKHGVGPLYNRVGEEYFRAHLEDLFDRYLADLREETPQSRRTAIVGEMISEIFLLRMQRDGKLP